LFIEDILMLDFVPPWEVFFRSGAGFHA